MAVRTFTDRKFDPAFHADRRPPARFSFVGVSGAWTMAAEALARAGLSPCPGCSGGPLGSIQYCLCCDRCGLDGRASYPGLPVDYVPDPDYEGDGSRYAPDGRLEGGVGRRRKARRAAVDVGLLKPPPARKRARRPATVG